MKTPPHRNTAPRPEVSRFYETNRPVVGQAPRLSARHHPPATRHPRYPSLSDDHQPPLISVRVMAILLLVALIIALAVGL